MVKKINRYAGKCFFILTSFILTACISEDKPESINLTQNDSVSLSDVFSDVRVIQLESTQESLLSTIGRVKYYNGRYYVMDRGSAIFCFDNNGEFIYKIAAQGKGPGEYTYISAFTIDRFNNQIIIGDPATQRILIFDMAGNFIADHRIEMDEIMSYNRLFAINDTVLLIHSFNHYQLVFYSLNEEKVIHTDYPILHDSGSFSPWLNVYQSGERTYVLPNLGQDVMDVTEINPVKHFTWDFGDNNNTEKQIDKLINLLEEDHYDGCVHEAVGRDKLLNHYFIWLHETDRFRVAVVEFDNAFKHIIIDNQTNEVHVFDYFKEGVSLALSSVYDNKIITSEHRGRPIYKEMGREVPYFSNDHLPEDYRQIIDAHNIEIDNPFIVVYTFKE